MLSLKNPWAVEAMIRCYNHVYHVAYQSRYEDMGGVGVSYYGKGSFAPVEMEFLAFDPDPLVVDAKIHAYPKKPGDRYVVNTFHDDPTDVETKSQYLRLGYGFVETAMLMGLPMPADPATGWTHIHRIETMDELEYANEGLALGNERIPPLTFGDPHIVNFYAQLEHRAVGWAQLVTAYPQIGYLNQLYTVPVYRRRGIATRLLRRAHQEADQLGLHYMVLLASEIGMNLYRRAGYRPLAYLSVFRPLEDTP